MTAHRYTYRHGAFWAIIVAFSVAHARRLLLEGVEAIIATDHEIESCGVLEQHGER